MEVRREEGERGRCEEEEVEWKRRRYDLKLHVDQMVQ